MPRCLNPAWDRATTRRITSREFYQRVTAHFGVSLPYSRFRDLWCDLFDPMDGIEELVHHLASRFPLFLLSNTNSLHFDYIKERFSALLQPLQAFVLSYEVGSRKPEPAIYQSLIRQAGRPWRKFSSWMIRCPLWKQPGVRV